jgi:hypothetical protein
LRFAQNQQLRFVFIEVQPIVLRTMFPQVRQWR